MIIIITLLYFVHAHKQQKTTCICMCVYIYTYIVDCFVLQVFWNVFYYIMKYALYKIENTVNSQKIQHVFKSEMLYKINRYMNKPFRI